MYIPVSLSPFYLIYFLASLFLLCFVTTPKGYLRPREYIVTEFPLKSTISDFWSLVYDHEVTSVVVLCNPSPLEASVRRLKRPHHLSIS